MRPSWDRQAMDIALVVARRSTCVRAIEKYEGIGAVLVDSSNRILGTGYAGSLPNDDHCIDVGCLLGADGGCQRTIHAEMNAIMFARPFDGPKTLYSTVSPCLKCLQLSILKGVTRVVFAQRYRLSEDQEKLCASLRVRWEELKT